MESDTVLLLLYSVLLYHSLQFSYSSLFYTIQYSSHIPLLCSIPSYTVLLLLYSVLYHLIQFSYSSTSFYTILNSSLAPFIRSIPPSTVLLLLYSVLYYHLQFSNSSSSFFSHLIQFSYASPPFNAISYSLPTFQLSSIPSYTVILLLFSVLYHP